MFERFTEQAIKSIMLAQTEAKNMGHSYVGTEQILLGLLGAGGIAQRTLNDAGIEIKEVRRRVGNMIGRGSGHFPVEVPFSPRAKQLLEASWDQARALGHNFIGTEHLLLGLIVLNEGVAVQILEHMVDLYVLRQVILERIGQADQTESNSGQSGTQSRPRPGRASNGVTQHTQSANAKATPMLEKFGEDLVKRAADDKLQPVIGRGKELRRMFEVLTSSKANNVILVGESGAGKTAVIEALAGLMRINKVPKSLRGKRLVAINLGAMVAGTKFRGEFEERIQGVIDEVAKQDGRVIVVIEDLTEMMGAGSAEGSLDACAMFKRAMKEGKMQIISSGKPSDYSNRIEKDPSLKGLFAKVDIAPATIEETVEILKGLKHAEELHSNVTISDEVAEAIPMLASRYLSEGVLPKKAIDLLAKTCSRMRVEADERIVDDTKPDETPEVTVNDIALTITDITGIPAASITESEKSKLLRMEDELHLRVIGQNEAIEAVADAVRIARAGIGEPGKPIASFIFSGPTGVGKTELSKALAEYLFNDEKAIVRIDMNEFSEKIAVTRLTGSAPGYVGYEEGGQLTEQVRAKPFSVVLFDEIEKAHPDVHNVLLRLVDEGKLTDAKGRTVDFTNTIVIATTNVGAEAIANCGTSISIGLKLPPKPGQNAEVVDHASRQERIVAGVKEAMKKVFKPEFLNRFGGILTFQQLTKVEIGSIVDLQLGRLSERLQAQSKQLVFSDDVKEFLGEVGFDPAFGARPLQRAIKDNVEKPLAKAVLQGRFSEGDTIVASLGADRTVVFTKKEDA
jgi:ATP-dependent Clp protease ATP-binding subunit ClpC